MDDRVIHDVLVVLGRPQGSYAESFVALSLLLAELLAFEKTGHKMLQNKYKDRT